MQNRYSPPKSSLSDLPTETSLLRVFYICVATSIITVFGIVLGALFVFGELPNKAILGLSVLVIPPSIIVGAVISQFRGISVIVGAIICTLTTLVATVVLALLASGRS
jgi:hypothetical protein